MSTGKDQGAAGWKAGAWVLAGLAAFGLATTAVQAMPRWQKRVVIGRVVPTATDEALVFAPGTGFACKLIDETKPLAEQSTDDPCAAISVRAYLKAGDTLLPGPTMTGTLKEGVRASWAEWGTAAAAWGPLADKLLPDANGNVKLGIYTTPLEGGCLPKVAVDKPAVDKAGEGCLSIHGTLEVPLRKLGEMRVESAIAALEADVKQEAETDGTLQYCARDFEGCTDARRLLVVAGCPDGDVRPACVTFRDRIAAQEGLRVPAVVDEVFRATVPSEHANWYPLLDVLDNRPERLGGVLASARERVVKEGMRRVDVALKEEDQSDAARWIKLTEKHAAKGSPEVTSRRTKLTQMVARLEAEARAEAAHREARERPCVAGCMRMVVACDGNPSWCGGSCNYSNACPCCTPAPNDCKRGGVSRMVYNYDHPECK